MSERTPGEVAVVKPYYAVEEAYQMGHDNFADAAEPAAGDEAAEHLTHFKESAAWANNIAPSLRAMAGFGTAKSGTYQIQRDVATIRAGCEEDEPAEAELVPCSRVYESLVDAFDMGARDGLADVYDPDSARFDY